MAGSLSHIVDPDGSFRMDLIDNLGDAHEALEECFDIIGYLCRDPLQAVRLRLACEEFNYPMPDAIPIPGQRFGAP